MVYVLNERQQLFLQLVQEKEGLEDDEFGDEMIVNRALSALARETAESWRKAGEISEEELTSIIDKWCCKFEVRWNGTSLLRDDSEGWIVVDEFSRGNSCEDAFPELYESFQLFLKAYGFLVDEKSYGSYSISYYR